MFAHVIPTKKFTPGYLLLFLFLISGSLNAQVTRTWNGSVSGNWGVAANWTPAGVPATIDNVIIVSAPNNPTLVASATVTNFTMTSGTLNLGGFTLNAEGVQVFTAGTIQNGTIASVAAVSSLFTNTTFAATTSLTLVSGIVTINGGTFNGPVDIHQNGAGNTTGNGNATFNNTTKLKNSATGYFRANGNMTFNGATEFIVAGSGYLLFELNTGNTYNGALTLTQEVTSTAEIRMGYAGTTNYNGGIAFNNLSGSTIRFGETGSSVNNLTPGALLSVGGLGFSSGNVYFVRFYQLGSTAQNFTTTGTARVLINNSIFNGNLTITSPEFSLANSTYNGVVNLTKTGPLDNNTAGGNTFNQDLIVNHNGTVGYWSFGNGTADIYNGNVYANNNSQDRIIFGHDSGGNQFNGNIILTQIGSSQGIALTWGPGTATIAPTKTISIGGLGYSVGYLYTQGVTQLGSAPINLTLTGTASAYLGPNATFGGPVTITSPSIYARGATYNSPVIFTKNGFTNDHNNGNQNIFNSTLEVNQQGTGYFMVGYNSNDQFNGNITVSSVNTGGINFGWTSGSGTSTLAAGSTILVGGAGFSQGYLRLGSFTQLGTASINLNLNGADFYVENDPVISVFGGSMDITASNLHIRGGQFNGATSFTKTGSIYGHNDGNQNIFNAPLTINQQGTGYFMLGYNSNDLFNENITVTSTNTGGINLGWTSGTGTPTLAAGKTVIIGGGGFSDGYLYFGGFTQLGSAAMNLTMGSAAALTFRNSSIGGAITSTSGTLLFHASAFNGVLNMEKTGANNDWSQGGNTFNQSTTLTNSGSGYLLLGNGAPDIFNNNLTLNNTGTNNIYLAYNSTGNMLTGDLTIQNTGTANQVRVLENSSTLTVTGTTTITNNTTSAASTVFYGLTGTLTHNGSVITTNSSSGDASNIIIGNNTGCIVTISGNVTMNNIPSGLSGHTYLGNQSTVTVGGQVTAINNASGNSGEIYVASGTNSTVTIAGPSSFTNSNSGTTKRIWLGNDGDIIFNGVLTISNSATATNSAVNCNYTSNSVNQYNQNIIVSNTAANEGIRFGAANGSGTLAATRTITIGGGGYTGGLLYFRNFTQVGPTPQTLITTGTTLVENNTCNWGGNIDFRGPRMLTRETVYNGTAYLEKTGAVNDASAGGNIFHGNTELRNSGSGYFLMGNGLPDVFDLNLLMTNSGTYRMYLAHTSAGNTVGGNLTINNTASTADNDIYVANNAMSTLGVNGNVIITNLSSATTATIYFPTDGIITVGGNLSASNNGTAATCQVSLANASSSSITITGNTTLINGGAGTTSRIYLGNSGDATLTGTLTMTNNSSSGNSEIYCNNNTNSANSYGGNISVESTNANGDGIRFGQSGGTGVLAATRTITIGGAGFVAGLLYFRNFTQVGPTPQTLITSGTTHFENYDSNWGGNVNFTGARMFTRGTIYQGTAYLEKFGANDDGSVGGNNFAGNTELRNTGSGYFLMGNGSPDIFQTNLLMNNIGTYRMYLAHSSAGNLIGGNLTVNNTGAGSNNEVYLVNSATSTLAISGNVILNNSSTATNSQINFPESGTATVTGNLTLVNNATGTNGQIYLCNGSATALTVTGNTQITNSNAGTTKRVYAGNNGDIVFDGTLAIINNSSATNSEVYCNHASNSLNLYNQNITVENTNATGDGIFFGNGSGFGTLAATKTITVSGGGFVAGTLQFRNFTQLSATAQSITLTGVGTVLENYSSTWNGNVTFIAPRHFTRTTTYNATAYLEKNGASNDASVGGNIYNGDVQFVVSGSGYFMPSNTTGDDHNANATFTKTSTGLLYPAYNSTSTFAGNITINSNSVVTFADNTNGKVDFDGAVAQSVNNTGSVSGHIMRRISMVKSADDVTLNTPINVSHTLNLVIGRIITSATNLVIMLAGSSVTAVSDASYVSGPIRKVGNTAFDFPVGKGGVYRPISMSAPSNAAHHFTAEYFKTNPDLFYNILLKDPSLHHLSTCEYWILDRTNGTSNVTVTLSWAAASCGVTDMSQLRVARWNGSMWKDHGNGGVTGVPAAGTVVTAAAVTAFSPFTLSSITFENPLPIELTSFTASCENNAAVIEWKTASESNNDFFTVEKSNDGLNWNSFREIDGAGNSSVQLGYTITDLNPYAGTSYYRLKQTDFNGDYEYFNAVSVTGCDGPEQGQQFAVFPNPSNGLFNFNSAFTEEFTIFVSDINGRNILRTFIIQPGVNSLELSDLSKGVYLITFTIHDNSYVQRIVLN